jgi:hypothetical protein
MKTVFWLSALHLCLLLQSTVLAEQIIRWTDETGRIHYSDNPPADESIECEQIHLELPEQSVTKEQSESRRQHLIDEARRRVDQRLEARKNKFAEQRMFTQLRSRRCEHARTKLVILQEKFPVYRDIYGELRRKWYRDPYQGARDYLNEGIRDKELAQAIAEIEKYCTRPDDHNAQKRARENWEKSEMCEVLKAEYAELLRPNRRTPDYRLDEKLREIKEYCDDKSN